MTVPPEDNHVNPFAPPKVSQADAPSKPEVGFPLSQYVTVRTGLQLVHSSIGALAGVFVITLISGFILNYTGPAPAGFNSFLFLSGLACLAAILAMIVGFCMTLASPRREEKTLAIISVVCFFLATGGSFASMLLAWTAEGSVLAERLLLGCNILAGASMITFCLLVRQIGRNISSRRMEKRAYAMLVWFGFFLVVCIAGVVVVRMLDFYWGLFVLATAAIALTTLFMYLAMVQAGIDELKPRQDTQ